MSGDGRDDIVVMSGQGLVPNLQVLTQLAGGGFAAPAASSVPAAPLTQGIGVGDVTGDGRIDVVASYGGNRPSSGLAVFAQTAGGTLAAAVTYPSGDIPEPVEVADVTGDGRADVIVAHGGWNLRRRVPRHERRDARRGGDCTRSRTRATTARTASRSVTSPATRRPTSSSRTTTTGSSSCATRGSATPHADAEPDAAATRSRRPPRRRRASPTPTPSPTPSPTPGPDPAVRAPVARRVARTSPRASA